jgi:hypothetical protein
MNLNEFFMMIPVYIGILIVVALIFLALRKLMLWYWGISKIIQQQEELMELLKQTLKKNN